MAYTTIDDPTAFFQCTLHTGTGSEQAITHGGNSDLQADLVWIKRRDAANNHRLTDVVRGATKEIYPDLTDAEDTQAQGLKSFASDGFTLGTNAGYNANNGTYVSWNWKANGSGSANTAGSIDTTATSANTTSGFSISTYTGNGTAGATIGHGLGAVPKAFFIKRLENNDAMNMYNESLGNGKTLRLDRTNAVYTDSSFYNNTSPTSSLITLGDESGFNGDGSTYVIYVVVEKQGFSKVGAYTGNGNANGTFVYTGFRPAWVMIKQSSGADNWVIYDNKRDGFNGDTHALFPNTTAAQTTDVDIDLVSNGFKIVRASGRVNASGETHIYMAFAENPFVTSTGIPAVAR